MIKNKLYLGALLPDIKAFINFLKAFILSPIETIKERPLQVIILVASIIIIVILLRKNNNDLDSSDDKLK